jgi:Tfp pilus assembly protein PilE
MDQGSQELRRAAAEAFMQAIAQLETTLQLPNEVTDPTTASPRNAQQQADSANSTFDLNALADAAADIEQFIQAQTPTQPPETEE